MHAKCMHFLVILIPQSEGSNACKFDVPAVHQSQANACEFALVSETLT